MESASHQDTVVREDLDRTVSTNNLRGYFLLQSFPVEAGIGHGSFCADLTGNALTSCRHSSRVP